MISEKGLKELHIREGLSLKPYLCTQGKPTIGFGNTYYEDGTKVKLNDPPITKVEAVKLGKIIAADFAKKVQELLKKEVNQNQFDALVSLAYNIGVARFAKSTVLRKVNNNPNDQSIGKAFMMWTKNPELKNRRKSEVEQYFKKI